MSGAADYLPLLWAAVAAAAILAYVLMDGWVLGIGILYPLVARQTDRELLVESIAPFWNANEILLVLGALLLLLGFPTACSLLLTQLHFPIFVMLFALIVRAASHEFRHTGGSLRRIWELAFAGGSILAALAQGYIAGRLIEGFDGGDAFIETLGVVKRGLSDRLQLWADRRLWAPGGLLAHLQSRRRTASNGAGGLTIHSGSRGRGDGGGVPFRTNGEPARCASVVRNIGANSLGALCRGGRGGDLATMGEPVATRRSSAPEIGRCLRHSSVHRHGHAFVSLRRAVPVYAL
jgi:hypothetical protein